MSQPAKELSKGPGPVRDGLDKTQSRVYHAVQFCTWVQHARECLAAARGESGPLANRLCELAREDGRRARTYYAAMMESGVAA